MQTVSLLYILRPPKPQIYFHFYGFFHPVRPDLHRRRDLITLFPPCRCIGIWCPVPSSSFLQPLSFIINHPFDALLRVRDVFLGHTAVSDTLIRFALSFRRLSNTENSLCRCCRQSNLQQYVKSYNMWITVFQTVYLTLLAKSCDLVN